MRGPVVTEVCICQHGDPPEVILPEIISGGFCESAMACWINTVGIQDILCQRLNSGLGLETEITAHMDATYREHEAPVRHRSPEVCCLGARRTVHKRHEARSHARHPPPSQLLESDAPRRPGSTRRRAGTTSRAGQCYSVPCFLLWVER